MVRNHAQLLTRAIQGGGWSGWQLEAVNHYAPHSRLDGDVNTTSSQMLQKSRHCYGNLCRYQPVYKPRLFDLMP